MTLHSRFCGQSLQRYLSLAECLEPISLDSLPIDLAGKLFEIITYCVQFLCGVVFHSDRQYMNTWNEVAGVQLCIMYINKYFEDSFAS